MNVVEEDNGEINLSKYWKSAKQVSHLHLLNLRDVPKLHFASAIFFIMYEDSLTLVMLRVFSLAEV